MTLPLTPEELTPQWLSEALKRTVTAAEVEQIVWGTATKVLMRLSYAEDPGPGGPASAVCVKGGFSEDVRAFAMSLAYEWEAHFYADLAGDTGLRLPACWYSASDSETHQGIIILENLLTSGATFGEPTEPWDADRVAAGLDQLALLHGATWGEAAAHAWVGVGSAPVRGAAAALHTAEHWEVQFNMPDGPRLQEGLADRERSLRAFHKLWELDDAQVHCIVHGDSHVGNTFLDRDGNPGFVDWQSPCLAPYSYDVSYFIGGALPVEVRREKERDLLRHYLQALAAAGGPAIDWDEAWLDYRRHALHGFLWAMTPPVMQSVERVVAMGERHMTAIEDLEAFDALGV